MQEILVNLLICSPPIIIATTMIWLALRAYMQPLRGMKVRILHGAGAGQVRRIKSHNKTTLTLDKPLDTAPDATSAITITVD
jgi:hypothetical protein